MSDKAAVQCFTKPTIPHLSIIGLPQPKEVTIVHCLQLRGDVVSVSVKETERARQKINPQEDEKTSLQVNKREFCY